MYILFFLGLWFFFCGKKKTKITNLSSRVIYLPDFYVQEVLGSLRVHSKVMASAASQVCVDVCDGGRKTGTVSGSRTAEPSRRVRSGHSTSSARLRAGTEAPLWSLWLHFFPSSQRDCWHRTPLNSCGQMQRWFWWHVPPFWHISSSSSQTFAREREK